MTIGTRGNGTIGAGKKSNADVPGTKGCHGKKGEKPGTSGTRARIESLFDKPPPNDSDSLID